MSEPTAYTDYPLFPKDPTTYAPLRKVEVLSYDSETEVCRVKFEGKLALCPAGYLYKKQQRYSPSFMPERFQPNQLKPEKLQKTSILRRPQSQ